VSSQPIASIAYSCPYCLADLDPPATSWNGWVRCPSCTRVFLPPEIEHAPFRAATAEATTASGGSELENGQPAAAVAETAAAPRLGRMAHTSGARLVLTTGFVLCLLLTLIAFLDSRPAQLAIFGFMTIGLFLLLLRTPRRRLPIPGTEAQAPGPKLE
jgi:hypothetical protein